MLAVGLPMVCSSDRWGREDWDYFAHHYEAMRRSVIDYGQVPWWNPWCGGGLPLAANPQIGLLSLHFLFVLLLGTYPGLKWSALVHLLIAAEGTRRLARDWLGDPLAAAVAALAFAANGSVALYHAAGHLGIGLVAWIPWAVAFALRIERDSRWGLALGGVLAIAVLESFQYFVVYLSLVLCGLLGWRWWVGDAERRRRLVRGLVPAACLFLALAGLRTALAAQLIVEFPRGRFSQMEQRVGPGLLVAMLALPGQGPDFVPPPWADTRSVAWHEYGCYVGVIACVLFLASLRGGWCWWHSLALTCLWLAAGNAEWYHPSAWLARLPVLSTLRLATRWRVIAMLGVALACGSVLARWRQAAGGRVRIGVTLLGIALAADVVVNAVPIFRQTFVVPSYTIDSPPVRGGIVQLHNQAGPAGCNSAMLATLQAGYGLIYGYEPLVGVTGSPISGRLWLGHADYRGEYTSPAGPVEVVRWTPNAISLQAAPGAAVVVNQNPGAYWRVHGRPEFGHLRSVDRHAAFRVQADPQGRVELATWPTGWTPGLLLTVAGWCGLAVSLAFPTRRQAAGGRVGSGPRITP